MNAVADRARSRPALVDHDRFVGFAFAAANMVIEADAQGCVVFAAGSFRTALGREPETYLGLPFTDAIALSDHAAVLGGLALLRARGRLAPISVRLANPAGTTLALAGLAMPGESGQARLFLTLAPLPEAAGAALVPARGLLESAVARLGAAAGGTLQLLEVSGEAPADSVRAALRDASAAGLAGELAPGRYGVLPPAATAGTAALAAQLAAGLQEQGFALRVDAHELALGGEGLTPAQTLRALRHALEVFARDGQAGLARAGFSQGLAGYVRQAGCSAGALRRALREAAFDLAYQPIVALYDGSVQHYEALLRPKNPPGIGDATPQGFVCLVEQLGMAPELDEMVARLACEAAHRSGQKIAFNISAASAQDAAFRARLLQLLKQAPACGAGLVSVEMTETASVEDLAEVAATAAALREAGVAFCLDDFGAGSSDMRVLRAVPADLVKIDGSYVREARAGGRGRALLAGMVEIARAAGARIVAEHVETEAQATMVRSLGVELAQGFLFGRPGALPAAAAPRVARRRGARESWG